MGVVWVWIGDFQLYGVGLGWFGVGVGFDYVVLNVVWQCLYVGFGFVGSQELGVFGFVFGSGFVVFGFGGLCMILFMFLEGFDGWFQLFGGDCWLFFGVGILQVFYY